jgi:hypothetical protein
MDLTYRTDGTFTQFLPESKAGETAWNQMAELTGGTGKVLTMHKQNVIGQLRRAGFKVGKAKPVDMSLDQILDELEVS